jgi:hypothetical protein
MRVEKDAPFEEARGKEKVYNTEVAQCHRLRYQTDHGNAVICLMSTIHSAGHGHRPCCHCVPGMDVCLVFMVPFETVN